jgi:DNA modification methylase
VVELFWNGKRGDRVDAAVELPLETVETIDEGASTEWQNRLILGDKKYVLPSLRAEFGHKVDLVYIDPPFYTGADRSVTIAVPPWDDSSPRPASSLKRMAYRDTWGPSPEERARGLTPLDKYLQWFAETASLLRELLSDTGLLFVHLDDNVGHEAKVVLDETFGADRFRGEIIWQLGTGAKSRKFFSIQHNIILVYSGGDAWTYNYDAKMARQPFAQGSLGTHFRRVDEHGRRYRIRTINGKNYKYFADEGRAIGSVWTDISSMTANSPIIAEGTGYPTQKPEKLLERILGVCTRPGDLILDCFCGSGTTPAVAGKLGRRWIACDVSRFAVHMTRKRLLASHRKVPFVLQTVGGRSCHAARDIDERDFFEPRVFTTTTTVERLSASVRLSDFVMPRDDLEEEARAGVHHFSQWIDYWSIDWDHRRGPFHNQWRSYRTRHEPRLALSAEHAYEEPGTYGVVVKVIDIFGREAKKTISVTVE